MGRAAQRPPRGPQRARAHPVQTAHHHLLWLPDRLHLTAAVTLVVAALVRVLGIVLRAEHRQRAAWTEQGVVRGRARLRPLRTVPGPAPSAVGVVAPANIAIAALPVAVAAVAEEGEGEAAAVVAVDAEAEVADEIHISYV